MQRIEITHTTRYCYTEPVKFLEHKLLLRPREGHDIRIVSSGLKISPDFKIAWQRDVYGNSVALVSFKQPSDLLEIVSTVVVEQYGNATENFALAASALSFPFSYPPLEQIDLEPYQTPIFDRDQDVIEAWLRQLHYGSEAIETMSFLNRLNKLIADKIEYLVRDEPGVQSPARTLERAKGSCRDVSTLFIEACRQCGLAARFVSGYLVSNAAVKDTATTHAWSEVYLPGAGWHGFDSTSGELVGDDHIAAAVHRHPEAIPPVSGSFIGPLKPKPDLRVTVQVQRLDLELDSARALEG